MGGAHPTGYGFIPAARPIARNGFFQLRRKKARVSAAPFEQPPAAARAQVVAAELLVQFLVAVDNPAAPLHVSLAKDSLDVV